MEPPTTPSKKDGEGVSRLIRSLNMKWGLGLPVKDMPYSPSKVIHPERRGERIYQRIRFLYFRRPEALELARKRFEEHAQQNSVNWVYKPLAETDTIPSRNRPDFQLRKDSYPAVNCVPEAAAVALEETLFRFLDEATGSPSSPTRRHSVSRYGNRGGNVEVQQRTEQPALPKAPSNSQNALNMNLRSPKSTAPSSSYLFNPDQITSDIIQDILMADAETSIPFARQLGIPPDSPTPLQAQAVGSGDVFTTPPSTPAGGLDNDVDPRIDRTETRMDIELNEQYYLQSLDQIKLPQNQASGGRKHPLPDAPTFPIPRKMMTPEAQGRRVPQIYGGNHLEPTISSGAFDRRRSFDNGSQMTASTVDTTLTTPNTSFYTESAATSFGASVDDDASAQLMREHKAYSRQKLADTHLEPWGDAMDLDLETPRKADQYSMEPLDVLKSNPPTRIEGLDTADYWKKYLQTEDQFGLDAISSKSLPFRQLYETSRVALHCRFPFANLPSESDCRTDDYEQLWSLLKLQSNDGKAMPERSPDHAWDKAEVDCARVIFSGDLKFTEKGGGPVFHFQLKPLKVDKSNRVSRKFGGDRLFVLGLPSLEPRDLPSYLKSNAVTVRDAIIWWLHSANHQFLGRTWRAFYIKPQHISTNIRKKNLASFNEVKHRVYLFAVDGYGFRRRSEVAVLQAESRKRHVAMTVNDLLEWFMPFKLNAHQPCLKFFSRLKQAVSDTIETVSFEPGEMIRTYDAFAHCPGVRQLSSNRVHRAGKEQTSLSKPVVMNDGCARISRAAAAAISDKLGLQGLTPSVFQGRIAGAKGIWMVDALGEGMEHSDRGYWIEITESQLKFEGHPIDAYDHDPARLTFEVNTIAKPLIASKMNFQLMPILIDRGVPGSVFERLLEEDLTMKVAELELAMDSGLALRKWTQDNYPVTSERRSFGCVEMLGGLPSSNEEKINWFVEHGFEPKSCRMLKDLCYKAICSYCDRLEARMNIGIGRSTTAFMIADPLAVLEDGEVHIGFSGAFRDERSGFHDTMLNGIDILVARSPALLPSDIQKVRAVFKPELAIYKDVIIFPSKGPQSLADKLSGGDYDGDRAWICWEPDFVNPFINAGTPPPRDPEYYGITKDSTRISDIIDSPDYISQFLHKAFDFNMQSQMIGICTIFHEALCYRQLPVSHPIACDVALLLGHLVDSSKGGLIFTEGHWAAFKEKHKLPKHLIKPAYKDKFQGRPTNHIIDRLVFQVAKGVSDRALGAFDRRFANAGRWDHDLNAVWKAEDETSKRNPALKKILDDLRAQCIALHDFWATNCTHPDPDEAGPSLHRRKSNGNSGSFNALVEQSRERFLAIQPLSSISHPMIDRWTSDSGSTCGSWLRLKASTLWRLYCNTGKFVWYVCGKELGELKVLGRGKTNSVVEELYINYRVDARATRKLGADDEAKGAVLGEEEEEEFGNWDALVDGMFDKE